MSSSRVFLLIGNSDTEFIEHQDCLYLPNDGKIFYCAILQTLVARAATAPAKR